MISRNLSRTSSSPALVSGVSMTAATPVADGWLATLAHELRDPLHAVLLSLAELSPACAAEPEARAAHETAERASRHMSQIITDVLELACGSPSSAPAGARVELGEIVARSIEIARPLLSAGRHRLSVLLPPEPMSIASHPARLAQILSNLLINAAKFTQPEGNIYLSIAITEAHLIIRVRDNGCGIDPVLLPQVFDLFRRDDSTPRTRAGRGIGLALVKFLCNLQGGSAEARSDGPGTGSEFLIRLPLVSTASVDANVSN